MDRHSALIKPKILGYSGSTLIEVLVGGLLVAIFVTGLFQTISGGSWLNRRDLVRRRSFQELERVLDNPTYSYKSPYYSALAPGQNDSMSVVLDDRGDTAAANNLNATIKVHVDTVSFTRSGTIIPAKKLTAKIVYTDDGVQYQDSLQTFVTLVDIN